MPVNTIPRATIPRAEPSGILRLLRGKRHERAGYTLYGAAVAAARQPFFYLELGVPDTLDGRFDMVGLYAFLLIRRLTALPVPGPALAQAMFDAMFNDMDLNLREMGVGDMSVGKRVRDMWEAFHGRAEAYAKALEAPEPVARLSEALARNVWRGAEVPPGPAPGLPDRAWRLAEIAIAQSRHLETQDLASLRAGIVAFAAP